jgi:imidazolonepropionase-like amidohydrolase
MAIRAVLLPALAAMAAAGCGASGIDNFVRINAPVVALAHVRVIDGTGRPGIDDQILVIQGGRIARLGPAAATSMPAGAEVLNLAGRTVIPGLVGMHDHLFYEIERGGSGTMTIPAQSTFARLYLASGVTTIRTAGTVDLEGDVRLKQRVDEGREPGPTIYVTGPYLNAAGAEPDPIAIARQVFGAAAAGATSFKAYTSLRFPELQAAIEAAHSRGLQVTGHLCAVGFHEAASLGIDNLEHGLFVDTEFYSGKLADQCPDQADVVSQLLRMDVGGPQIRRTIADLVRRNVAITSTLAVLETLNGRASSFDPRLMRVLSSGLQQVYEAARDSRSDPNTPGARAWMQMLLVEMEFERAFVRAGGRLLAGVDPTGWGGVLAGFGDQRELELLVAAGFSPEEAIRIATSNGAAFLRERDLGTIAAGQRADLVVVRGNPSTRIADIRNVEMVFKNGVAYDPAALIEATNGTLSQYDFRRLLRWPWNAIIGTLTVLLIARVTWRVIRKSRSHRGTEDTEEALR